MGGSYERERKIFGCGGREDVGVFFGDGSVFFCFENCFFYRIL